MRSKTFYSKFAKASFVKQLWIMGLTAFFYFLVMLLPLAVMINNWQDGGHYTIERKMNYYMQFMLQADGAYVLLVGLAAIIAIIQFSYLHSRRQMDFYGSLPIKRKVLFSQKVLFSYIDFVVPYTVVLGICFLIGLVHNIVTANLIVYVVEMWVVNQVGFMLMFLICSLAILLTGRNWVGLFGSCIFLSGGYLLEVLFRALNSTFFQTYYETNRQMMLSWLSPVFVLYKMRDMIFELEKSQILISGKFVWLILAVTVFVFVLFLLNRYVVRKRPAEKAGQSMAFEIPSRVIQVILSVVGGVAIGIMTMTFIYVNEQVWFFMGAIFGTFFLYVLIQFIYTLDVKQTFAYKWQVLATEAAAILICSIYSFDLFGYDLYLPKQEDIESVAIRYQDDNAYTNYYIDGIFYNGIEYALEEMSLEPDNHVYALLEDAVYKTYEGFDLNTVYVRYRLKNGREINRVYQVSLEGHRDKIEHLYEQEAFRETMIPTMQDRMFENMVYEDMSIYYAGKERPIYNLEAKDKILEFIEVYNAEMKKIDASVFVESTAIARLSIFSCVPGDKYGISLVLPIYPECTKTLGLLKEMGYDPVGAVDPENIEMIEVTDWNYEEIDAEVVDAKEMEAQEETVYVIKDKEEIALILSCMVDDYYADLWQPREAGYQVCVYMKDAEPGANLCFYGAFREGEIPEEVLDGSLGAMVY